MAGALSTLGLGSHGVLTNDIIDQLKEADTTSIIKPIENKIELSTSKQSTLSDIKKLITDLNDQIVSLSEPELYKNKKSSLTGSTISVETSASAKEQNFEIDVKSLATRDIQESAKGFAYDDALLDAQTLTLEIGTDNFDIEVKVTDSLKSIVNKINEQTDGKIEASILNVGGDNPYKLILKSANTGADSKITVSSSEADPDKAIAFNRIGDEPKDAEIEIDGITVTRSDNSFDDLVEGVKINLQAVGKTSVKIENDNEKLVEKMSEFADKYNTVIEKLSSVTKYDKENKTAGVFQGTSEIRAITSALNSILGRTISSDGKTVADFGLEPQRGGKLKFSESDFKEMLKTDAGKVEDFFRGTNGENGLFNKFEDTLFDLATSSTGALKSLDKNIENNLKALAEEQSKAQKRLDDRYKIMTKRFAAFDSVISKLSHQSTTLQSMIDAQFAEKK